MKPQWLIVLAVLFLTGCLDSKNPLSAPTTSKPDERLVGVWRLLGDGGRVTNYHVGRAGEKFPKGMMRAAFVQHEKGKPESSGEFLLFPTTLVGKTYLNVIDEKGQVDDPFSEDNGWKPDAVESYHIFKYEVDGNKLVVWGIDEKTKQQAIKGGKIKGVIEKDKPAKFTDTTENVARFVTGAGDSLFSKEPFRLEMVGSSVRRTEPQHPEVEHRVERWPSIPTPPLRPLGKTLMVDKNGIIWNGGHPVGIWGVNGGEMRSEGGFLGR